MIGLYSLWQWAVGIIGSGLFALNSSSGGVATAGSLVNNSGSHTLTLSASDGTNAGTAAGNQGYLVLQQIRTKNTHDLLDCV